MGNVNLTRLAPSMNMANAMNGAVEPLIRPPQPVNMPSASTKAEDGQPEQHLGLGGALIPIAVRGPT